jgi:hypothetical protein
MQQLLIKRVEAVERNCCFVGGYRLQQALFPVDCFIFSFSFSFFKTSPYVSISNLFFVAACCSICLPEFI